MVFAGGLIWGEFLLPSGPANDRSRRLSPVASRPGEGPLTDPIAGAPLWLPELVFMPDQTVWLRSRPLMTPAGGRNKAVNGVRPGNANAPVHKRHLGLTAAGGLDAMFRLPRRARRATALAGWPS